MQGIKEVAEELGITPQQVRNLCRDGKIKAKKIGKTWVIEDIDKKYFVSNTSYGVAEDHQNYNTKAQNHKRPIALSFFSGAMGLDIGLEKAGFNTIFSSEIDNACRKTIRKNKPDITLIGDIRDYSSSQIRFLSGLREDEEIDLVVGGPPCQAFSTAGNRKGFEDERGNVFLTFIDRIIELNPNFAVIENVRGLLSAPLKHRPHNQRGDDHPELNLDELPGGALNHIIKRLKEAGYNLNFNLYNSANFGTPQQRERVVIICSKLNIDIPFIEPTHSQNQEHGLKKWKNFKDAVHTLNGINHEYVNFPEKRLKYYRQLSAGQNWRSLPIDLQKEAMGASFYSGGGKTGFLRRLSWHKPSPTLVTHPAMPATDLAHPVEDRPLSIQEYKRIQQFPDNWEIEGSILDKYKQIGNAVPVGLGFAIGKHLIKLMNNEKIKHWDNFKYSRYKNTSYKDWRIQFKKEIAKAQPILD
ncbi:DNA cytosine methyltransferase [uncultured Draconibacterium sp.]|uniref:DNA cytosine methyltransferase n=1 Tax=uncultured Draconibacterium sp. TaxID=1573823 RepID=UPI002AA69370|nr:DNA cytosine methyltransferase [uncultured Draconibacterium sp.]